MFLALILAAHALRTPATQGWKLEGSAQVYGLPEKYEFLSDGENRFRDSILGRLPDIDGFDGHDCWDLDQSGIPHVESLQSADSSLLVAWVIDGNWNRPGSLVDQNANPDGTYRIAYKGGSDFFATLAVDPQTKLAKRLSFWTPQGTTIWDFGAYRSVDHRSFPTQITMTAGTEKRVIHISSVTRIATPDDLFTQPAPDLRRTTFDASVPASVETKRLFGYFFVHPLVDGKDIGWFLVDTGAGAMAIDPEAAKEVHADAFGKTLTVGVVATVETAFCQTASFQLGPVTMKSPTFLELDLSQIGKLFRVKLAGICGYDFLARVAMNLNAKSPAISVYPPGKLQIPAQGEWTDFRFNENLMYLTCGFEGHTGNFTIDTGSGSSVDFTTPIVEKYQLLKNRQTTSVRIGGAGGSATSRLGTLDTFEIAGNKLDGLKASFQTTKSGVYASPYIAGNIGAGILGKFNLFLDYASRRIALVPFATSNEPTAR